MNFSFPSCFSFPRFFSGVGGLRHRCAGLVRKQNLSRTAGTSSYLSLVPKRLFVFEEIGFLVVAKSRHKLPFAHKQPGGECHIEHILAV